MVDGVGVLIKRNTHGRYCVFIIRTSGEEILVFEEWDQDRAKGAAMRQASLALVRISQELTLDQHMLAEDPAI